MSWGTIVRLVHLGVVGYVVATPFATDSAQVLFPWLLSVLSIMFHWFANRDTCILTIVEAGVRGVPIEHGFIYSILAPVFNLHASAAPLVSRLAWLATIALVVYVARKLGRQGLFRELAALWRQGR